MTWQLGDLHRSYFGALGATFLVVFSAACGTTSKRSEIVIVSPESGAVLTTADDTDGAKSGLQLDVEATSSGVAAGTTVLLSIEGVDATVRGSVGSGGDILFKAVTLPPGTHEISIGTATGSVQSEAGHTYTFKAVQIASPADGATVTVDVDSTTDGLQTDVSVSAFGIESSEDLGLLVDGNALGDTVKADASAVFENVTLAAGEHTLQAFVDSGEGRIESEEITITVAPGGVADACPVVDFINPEAPASGGEVVLGGEGACPADGKFAIDVEVSTNAGAGAEVGLKVNGTLVSTEVVNGANVQWNDVLLGNRGDKPNTLALVTKTPSGMACPDVDFDGALLVDCEGPSCTITSPEPVAGVDENNDTAFYLNEAMRGASGFDVVVTTDASASGETVQLILEGRDRDPKRADAKASGGEVTATFANVALATGKHTVEARCVDAAGNVTFSPAAEWVVDVSPCAVTVTSPVDDFFFVPADDSGAASGVQVDVTSTLTGSDCVAHRAAPCDPVSGIASGSFADRAPGSAQLISSVTLGSAAAQTLCVEVQDRAGNVGLGSVDVAFRGSAPSVSMESPATGTQYNSTGGGGYTIDEDLASAVTCNATFQVLCNELGQPVSLHRDSASNAAFNTATCVATGGLPSGFAGRATFDKITFLSSGSTSANILATQTIDGDSGEKLVGASTAITLSGDCSKPVVVLSPDPCQGGQIDASGGNVISNVQANLVGGDIVTAAVSTSNTDGTTDSDSVSSPTSPVTFSALDFGGSSGGSSNVVTVTVTATDAFGNVGSAQCTANVVEDLPQLVLSAPTDGAVFGIGASTCNPGVAGAYGVQITGTADQATDRQAVVSVDGGADQPLNVAGTAVSGCVALSADGVHTLDIELQSTATGAVHPQTVGLTLDTLEILSPAPNAVRGPADACNTGVGGEYGVLVSASADLSHVGQAVEVQFDALRTVSTTVQAGGVISACAPAQSGTAALNVRILDGSMAIVASESHTITAVTSAPANGVTALAGVAPASNDAAYRSKPVTLTWTNPTQDFVGQLVGFELRCAASALDMDTATQQQANQWWTDAEVMTLPANLAPPTATADVTFRIGDKRQCVLRAKDPANQLTPLVSSTLITYPFRQHTIQPASTGQRMGQDVAWIGDVNNDNLPDTLVGGQGEAYLIFGTSSAPASSAPNVTFVGDAGSRFGFVVAGLGDFNDDGENDFAIAYRTWANVAAISGGTTNAGRVFVFYGRTANDWPASVDLTGACAADVCFDHEYGTSLFGLALSSAGDFNGDGVPDLAVGAPLYPGTTGVSAYSGRLYILMGQKFEDTMTKPLGQSFWQIAIAVPSAARGVYLQGDGGATVAQMGNGVASIGNFDGVVGDDLVVGAPSQPTRTAGGKLFFLSGDNYDLTTETAPMKPLALSQLGFRDMGGAPSGLPIDSGGKGVFANTVYGVGNVIDVPGASNPGTLDVAIKSGVSAYVEVYPGDNDFDPADKFFVDGGSTPGTLLGSSLAVGVVPDASVGAAELSDVDGDGLSDLCIGESLGSATGVAPGLGYLFYGQVLERRVVSSHISYVEADSVFPTAVTGSGQRVVDFVGDMSGDGEPDLAIGDPNANTNKGSVTLFY